MYRSIRSASCILMTIAAAMASTVFPCQAKTLRTEHASRPALQARIPAIQWTACTGEVPGLQCATVKAPLDYNDPDGPQIDIALARAPARNPSQRIGTLFLNPGGPGGSGVALIREGFTSVIDGAVLDRFDVVGWDPRGVGQSTPIQCWNSDAARQAYFANSPIFPYRNDQEQAFFDLRNNIFTLCANRGQNILWHMSTANVARDLDLLRQAVGDTRLNYIGYSYGSYIGHTYANLFSMNIRTMVLDGVVDPNLYSAGRMIESNKTSSHKVMQQFFSLCEAAGAQCPLNSNGGPRARFDKILNALRIGPILFNDGQGITTRYTYDSFVEDNVSMMNGPEAWPEYAVRLAAISNSIVGKKIRQHRQRAYSAQMMWRACVLSWLSHPETSPKRFSAIIARISNTPRRCTSSH
jgi:pimeloyl-ACP methyl ester carboxylesterase